MFQRVLGRSAGQASVDHFVGALDAGATRSTVARGILSSPEGRRVRVTTTTQAVLDRTPTAAELGTWTAVLHDARDTRALAVVLVATDEYHDT